MTFIMDIGAPLNTTQLAMAVLPDTRSTVLAANLLVDRAGQADIDPSPGLG